MKTSKAKVFVSEFLGKCASVVGYFLGVFGPIMTVFELAAGSPTETVFAAVIMSAVGIFFIVVGSKIKRRIARFRKYVFLISTYRMTSLNDIAEETSRSVDFVRSDLQGMIKRGFFVNTKIDQDADKIIVGGMTDSVPDHAQAQTTSIKYEMYTCAGCAATGMKKNGMPRQCEYCGSFC